MADRYWVGGTGNWDNIAGLKWSATSGGAGGASVPTTTDNVYFDANSGAGTVSINSGNTGCNNFVCTGYTGTISGSSPITIYGTVLLASSMTWTYNGTMTLTGGSAINSAGKTFANITISGGGSYQLTNNLTAYTLNLNEGTFSANDYNVTINNFVSNNNSLSRTLALGSGTWTVTGSGNVWDCTTTSSNLAVYGQGQGGTIKFTVAGPSVKQFYGGGRDWAILENAGTGGLEIYGSNSFDEIKNTINPATFWFQSGKTQTIYGNLNTNGTSGNLVQFLSLSSGSNYYLSKTSGTISVNYCAIKDCGASGGATWIAYNSTDNGNNTGWTFLSLQNSFLQFF